ncbi:MAG: transcriptional regulator [Firmicutes bacterium]|nr:transcriptional regulator [Bacillota bacterium]
MSLLRIGEKLISPSQVQRAVDEMLHLRSAGASQQEVAARFKVDRSFVSRLESLGEIHRGKHIALVGFPVGNKEALARVAEQEGVEFTLLWTEAERWSFVRDRDPATLTNEVLRLTGEVRMYDVVVVLASDQRLRSIERLLDRQVVGIVLGESPLTTDCFVDPQELRGVLQMVREEGAVT